MYISILYIIYTCMYVRVYIHIYIYIYMYEAHKGKDAQHLFSNN